MLINALRNYIKHSRECFVRYPNASKSVKKLGCSPFYNPDETHFLVLDTLNKILRNKQFGMTGIAFTSISFEDFYVGLRDLFL